MDALLAQHARQAARSALPLLKQTVPAEETQVGANKIAMSLEEKSQATAMNGA